MELTLTPAHNGQRFEIRVGDTIVLHLPETASSGYRWTIDAIDEVRLEIVGTGHRAGTEGTVGGEAAVFWKFAATSAGLARIAFKRWRPWEGERSVKERFEVKLEIHS